METAEMPSLVPRLLASHQTGHSPFIRPCFILHRMNRWATVTMIEDDGRRYSVDVLAASTFDAAHLFVTHAKSDPRNGIPKPSANSTFEVVVGGTIYRIRGKALQRWILKQKEERRGPAGYIFSKRSDL
jgi:hypothetical protein